MTDFETNKSSNTSEIQQTMPPIAARKTWGMWLIFLVIILLGIFAAAIHLLGLKVLNEHQQAKLALAADRQSWEAEKAQRETVKSEWEKLDADQQSRIRTRRELISKLAAEADNAQSNRDKLVSELERLKEDQALLTQSRDRAVREQSEAQSSVSQLKTEEQAIKQSILDLNQKIEALNSKEKQIKTHVTALDESASTSRTALASIVSEIEQRQQQLKNVSDLYTSRSSELARVEQNLRDANQKLTTAILNTEKTQSLRDSEELKIQSLQNDATQIATEITKAKIELAETKQLLKNTSDQALEKRLDLTAVEKLLQLRNQTLANTQENSDQVKAEQTADQSTLIATKTEINAIKNDIITLNAKQTNLQNSVDKLSKQAALLKEENRSLQEQIDSETKRLMKLQAQSAIAQAKAESITKETVKKSESKDKE